ncbi:hypothetical protein SK128_010276, partial [Halocaridina rubra]
TLLQSNIPTEAERYIFRRFQAKFFTVDQISTGTADHFVFLEKAPESVKLPVKEIGRKPKSHSKVEMSDKSQEGTFPVGVKSQKTTSKACFLCSMEDHRAKNCPKFPDATSRRECLVRIGCCSRYLRIWHDGKCTQVIKLKSCHKGNHNDIFCYNNIRKISQNVTESNTIVRVGAELEKLVLSNQCTQVTITNNKTQKSLVTRCFFDPGSQMSFITSKLVKQLQLDIVERC